ncbi:TonB family protein [Variovorax sp. W2I14]
MRSRAVPLNRSSVALWLLCGLAGAPWAAEDRRALAQPLEDGYAAQANSSAPLDFDIPTQPLAAALDQFAATSGRSALFSSTLVVGRTASPVHGRYTPSDALRRLLEGTGLVVEEVTTGSLSALVVKQASPELVASAATQRAAAQDRVRAYDSLLQARVWAALCADPEAARQDYQSLLRFQVAPSGRVTDAELLDSTGDRRRDAALVSTLRRVQIGRSPPPDLVQPVTLLILPPQDGGPVCAEKAE